MTLKINEKSSTNLKTLRLNEEGLISNFQEDVYEYYLTVLDNVNNIEVLAVADDPKAKVEITGNLNLKEGLNVIIIKVVSEDKTQSNTYKINVTKTKNLELSNTNLEILAIEDVLLYPQFDTNVTNYKAQVSNEINKLNIFAVPENENAKIDIIGNDDIKDGSNSIKIIVTAQNGFSKKEYNVEVYKRNQNEEIVYKEEQQINKNRLEEIYETEKVDSRVEQRNVSLEYKKENKSVVFFVIISILFVLLMIVLIRILKKIVKRVHK